MKKIYLAVMMVLASHVSLHARPELADKGIVTRVTPRQSVVCSGRGSVRFDFSIDPKHLSPKKEASINVRQLGAGVSFRLKGASKKRRIVEVEVDGVIVKPGKKTPKDWKVDYIRENGKVVELVVAKVRKSGPVEMLIKKAVVKVELPETGNYELQATSAMVIEEESGRKIRLTDCEVAGLKSVSIEIDQGASSQFLLEQQAKGVHSVTLTATVKPAGHPIDWSLSGASSIVRQINTGNKITVTLRRNLGNLCKGKGDTGVRRITVTATARGSKCSDSREIEAQLMCRPGTVKREKKTGNAIELVRTPQRGGEGSETKKHNFFQKYHDNSDKLTAKYDYITHATGTGIVLVSVQRWGPGRPHNVTVGAGVYLDLGGDVVSKRVVVKGKIIKEKSSNKLKLSYGPISGEFVVERTIVQNGVLSKKINNDKFKRGQNVRHAPRQLINLPLKVVLGTGAEVDSPNNMTGWIVYYNARVLADYGPDTGLNFTPSY